MLDVNEEVFGKRMTIRRFQTLVRGLPPDSAYGFFVRDTKNRSLVTLESIEGRVR